MAVAAAARANVKMIGPAIRALDGRAQGQPASRQHCDSRMSESFFQDLGLPEPEINLGVGSAAHVEEVAEIIVAFERYRLERKQDAVVIGGC